MQEILLKDCNIKIYENYKDCSCGNVIISNLIHGSNIVEIITGNENLNDCDALFTKSREFKLGIKTADCATVCYCDEENIGIAHIGWAGLCTDLNSKMLEKFNKSKLSIFIGPFNHRFEIQRDFCFDKLKEKFEDYFEYENSKIYFNFKKALLSILPENIVKLDDRNTFEDLSLPSYRRDKTKDRLLTVVSFK